MDGLSELLALYPVRTALDTRCCSSTAWTMERTAQPAGAAPYHLVVQGGALLRMPGRAPIALGAGDLLVLTRGQAHTLDVGHAGSCGSPTDILCGQLHFSTTAPGSLADALPDLMLLRTAGQGEFAGLQSLMHLLRDEAAASEPGTGAVVSHLASALLALTLRAWLKRGDAVPGLLALLAEQRLAAALNAMLKAPERAWPLDELALRCHMSRSTFLRAFRKASGTTPGELLTRVRMCRAAAWLEQGGRGIAEVGAAVGYQSESAFQRAFKRHTGLWPGQYRRDKVGALVLSASDAGASG